MSIFLYSRWLALPLSTKQELSRIFGFAKTGPTHVSDNRVIADGYKIEDVEHAMHVAAIQLYLGTKEQDYGILWDALIAKAEGRMQEVVFHPDNMTISPEDMAKLAPMVDDTVKDVPVSNTKVSPPEPKAAKKKGKN